MNDTSASFQPISFDQLCNALFEATEGISGETLIQQYDADENGSYARVSHIHRKNGTDYALIQLEEHAAMTQDFTTASITKAIQHLQQASRYRPDKVLSVARFINRNHKHSFTLSEQQQDIINVTHKGVTLKCNTRNKNRKNLLNQLIATSKKQIPHSGGVFRLCLKKQAS
ncbi:hypothetical protein V6U78_07290 [Marinospirillum sp. MEB164]|uniref:Uncharacterized protein n=1 Tax=Marinospirillum alkalitolerans TaxID=3123374 RepID=A0ABW8PY84_9GAMM